MSKERTLCEKIMSLVRFSQTEQAYKDLANKVRHIYDIHMMFKNAQVADFLNNAAFDELLNKVGNDDVISFKNNNKWLSNHPANSIIFKNLEQTWKKINPTYRTTFKDLVIGVLPPEEDLIASLKIIYNRLVEVKWQIDL